MEFREIVDRYGTDLYRLALSLVRNPEDAEDLLQETFLVAFQKQDAFAGRSSLKTWLIGILLKKAARVHRYRRIRRLISLQGLTGEDREDLDRKTQTQPGKDLALSLDIATMLESLSRKHREVVVLKEVLGLSYQEIGDTLGIPIGTVESRLYRARKELSERFKDFL